MRQPIDLDLTRAVGATINQALQTDAVRLALASFLEGRKLDGEWRLEIRGARLLPIEATSDGAIETPKQPRQRQRA